jgi:tetratricopeptide (TPR) repeat protein
MSEADESFGARLRRLRRHAGLTQEALGAGVYSGGYLSQLESGKRKPSRDAIDLFADRLDVDPDYLRTGNDPKLPITLAIEVQRAHALVYEDPKEAVARLVPLVAQARDHKVPEVQAKALEALGFAKLRDGATDAALDFFQQAEGLSMDSPLHTRCGCIIGIARCFQLSDPRYAAHVLESYLMQLKKESIPDPTALMRVNASLISVYFATGMPEQAVRAAEEAKRLEVRVEDPEQLACMNLNVASALLYQGLTTEAMVALRKSEDIFSSMGWKNEVARAAIAQGIIHAKVDDLPAAKASLEEALTLLAEVPNSLDEARARNELARAERLLGNPEAARLHAEKVLDLIPDGDPRERAFALREIALSSAPPARVERHLKEAIDLYRIASDPIEVASTFGVLGDFYREQGNAQAMAEAYRAGIDAIEDRAY